MIAKNYIELPTEGLVRGSILDEGNAVTVYLDVHNEEIPVFSGDETESEDVSYKEVKVGYPVRVEKPLTEARLVNAALQLAYGLRDNDDVSRFNADMSVKITSDANDDDVTEYLGFLQWVKLEYAKATGSVSDLDAAKQHVLSEIEAYDTSSAVNGFKLNGQTVWLDKATRVGLMNSTNIAKSMGKESTDLWLGNVKIEVGCDKAIQLLSALEMYALECFNVTAAHKKEIEELATIDEVDAYDITMGYPAQLEMKI